jgi:hypothetical protein
MKNQIKKNYVIIFIFLVVLLFRIFFVFNTPYFSSPESYYNLRHIEHIAENFKPIIYDELSYSGKVSFFPPLFYYIIALFFFIPFSLKIIPAILISSLVFVVYKISKSVFKNNTAALFSGFMVGFLPIIYIKTLNQISIFSLFIPLMFYTLYCFINLSNKKYMKWFIVLSFILPLIHPLSFLVAITLLFYYFLISAESLEIKKLRKEAILFFIFVTFIIEFIIFKKAFLNLGFNVIWQNIPADIIFNYFKDFNMLDLLYKVGFLPAIMGVIGTVLTFTRYQNKSAILISSSLLSVLFLMALRLIEFEVGALFLGISLSIMSALFIDKAIKYIKLTKFSYLEKYFNVSLFLLIIFTLALPCFFVSQNVIANTLSKEEFDVLSNLRDNTDKDVVIISSVEEGDYITGIAERKNVMDKHFLLVNDIDERYRDVKRIYTTSSEVIALQLLHKYNIDYIYISDKTKEIYNTKNPVYLNNENCFRKVQKIRGVEVYRVMC